MMEDKWSSKDIEDKNYIYQCFEFHPKIQEHTFIGNEFIGMDPEEETQNFKAFERVVAAGHEGFLPELVKELESLIGAGNYKYDGYEIGPDVFALYFLIKTDVDKKALKKIAQWRDYYELSERMWWVEK